MQITAGIFTFNVKTYQRVELLEATVQSLRREADRIVLIDNGSTDGSEKLVESMGGVAVRYSDGVTTSGRGMNTALGLLGRFADSELLVCSNDDIRWRRGWADRLRRAWIAAPENMLVITGWLQPIYEWDKPIGLMDLAGEEVLERTGAVGGGWTVRSRSLSLIGKVSEEKHGVDDVPKARELLAKRYRLGAIDIAEHIGQASSTWQTWRPGGNITQWIAHYKTGDDALN